MIFHRLGLINRNQRGFTLIELLVAVAITGIIIGGITMSIFQVFAVNARTSSHMTAVRQVQNAGYWISHDAQMAQQEPVIGDDPATTEVTEFLTLTWTEWESGDTHEIIYSLEDMPTSGELKKLRRSHSVNGTTEAGIVAEYIEPAMTNCGFTAGGELILTVTASVGGWQPASETRTYEVVPRPGS